MHLGEGRTHDKRDTVDVAPGHLHRVLVRTVRMLHDFIGEVWIEVHRRADQPLLQQVDGLGDFGDDAWVKEFTGPPYAAVPCVGALPAGYDHRSLVPWPGDALPGCGQGEVAVAEDVPAEHAAVAGSGFLGGDESVPPDGHVSSP